LDFNKGPEKQHFTEICPVARGLITIGQTEVYDEGNTRFFATMRKHLTKERQAMSHCCISASGRTEIHHSQLSSGFPTSIWRCI